MSAASSRAPRAPASALFTDFYELTMAQGYWKLCRESDQGDREAVFDVFFRHNPFAGGYSVFAGQIGRASCRERV